MILTYVAAFLCILALAAGQILFKVLANSLVESGSVFALKPLTILIAAMSVYLLTSLAWVWVLQRVELGRIYPMMALAFVLVPLGSYFIFGERFHPQYFIGMFILIVGMVIVLRA